MTSITKEMFAGFQGANAALINDVVSILNDVRFTFAEPLRQLLAQGKYIIRTEQLGDAIGPNDGGIFIDPKNINGVESPGQIVVKSNLVTTNGPLSAINLIEIIFHEGMGHGNDGKIADRNQAYTDLADPSTLTPTQRGDKFVQSWLDDETSARYESYLALKQMEQLNLWEPARIKFLFDSNPLFSQFQRLEDEAAVKNLVGDERTSFIIEGTRAVTSRYNDGLYTDVGTKSVLSELGYSIGTPQAVAFQAHVRQMYGGVRFTLTNIMANDDGSFIANVVLENGTTMDSTFDESGNLFRHVQTIPGNADTGRATIISTYSDGSDQPDRIEVQEAGVNGQVSSTYIQDANGNWTPTSWKQDGQTYTGDDLGTFIANLQNSSNTSDASASQSSTTSRLTQSLASASGSKAADVNTARNTADSLDTLSARLGMPHVSDKWAPGILSGQLPASLLLSSTMNAAISQALGAQAQSRINMLRNQPSIFTVSVLGFGNSPPPPPPPPPRLSSLQPPPTPLSLPLVLDLDNDGLELVSVDRSNASFDANATGAAQTIGWVGPRDGILVLDKNSNGIVDDAGEWFGQKFTLSGTPPANQDGFKALATLANAGATTLSASTSRLNAATGKRYFEELQVWIDADQDGKTDANELRSLASLGITSIDLNSQLVNKAANGNVIVSKAGYTTADGKRHEISDVGLSTEMPVSKDGVQPVSAAALAFAEYAGKGYAATALGQARAIATKIQGLPSGEQAALTALQQKFVLPAGTGPLSAAAIEAKTKMRWAVEAGLPQAAYNDKITYFIGPAEFRSNVPADWRRVNTASSDVAGVLSGITSLRTGELAAANAIGSAASTLSNAQIKAQVANATQTKQSRTEAEQAAVDSTRSWNSAIVGYLDVKAQMDAMVATLPAIQNKLNEVVPQNLNLTGHLAGAGTFLTRADATLAAEAFRAYAAALQPLAALKVTGDQLLAAIAQSQGYTKAYAGQNGQTITVGSGYNLLLGNRGSQSFVLGSGVDNVAVTSVASNITVSGFQVGSQGDQIQFLAGSPGYIDVSRDGSGNAVLKLEGSTVTLLGVDPGKLDLFANLSGAAGVKFVGLPSGTRSLRGADVYDGQMHISGLSASAYGDTLIGGERGSSLMGSSNADTFIVTGRDYRIDGEGGQDTVSYAEVGTGIKLTQTVETYRDDNLLIETITGTDNLGNIILDVSNTVGSSFNDILVMNGTTDNVVNGGAGNDLLNGGAGSDTYLFALGDGKDSIEEDVGPVGGSDTVSFGSGFSAAGMKVTRTGMDLVLSQNTNDSVTVKNWFAVNSQRVEQVRFADGASWDSAKINSLVNLSLAVLHPVAAQSVMEDAAWTFVLPADTFVDQKGGTLSYSATLSSGAVLPSWLHFNAATRTFTGTPLNAQVGSLTLQVLASNVAGASLSVDFGVNVVNTNDAPTIALTASAQTAVEGVPWSYSIPPGMFSDVDVGDKLIYRAARGDGGVLPAWLTFNAATRTFSGIATEADIGSLGLKITAIDNAGASVSQNLQLAVIVSSIGQTINGTAGNDTLAGRAGNDIIDGKTGADIMSGGAGDDRYYVDSSGDSVVEMAGMGVDTVHSTINTTLSANVENGVLLGTASSIIGNSLNNILTANDYGGSLIGGLGDDSYYLGSYENDDAVYEEVGAGIDTVVVQLPDSDQSFDLWGNVENLIATGNGDRGKYFVNGNEMNNNLSLDVAGEPLSRVWMDGGAGDDILIVRNAAGMALLTGGAGNDTLSGNGGADTMRGEAGNDSYHVENVADVVIELAGEGTDTVLATISYTLGENVENLIVNTQASINATGNALDNVLSIGGIGNNVINGLGGIDTASYSYATSAVTVSLAVATAQATGGSGSDTLLQIENLTGSAFNDKLTGNATGNVLSGGAGADTLNGGAGADTLIGGAGDDTYYVENASDVVTELAGEGTDTVRTTISYTLGANAENLLIDTTAAINATGNALANALYAGAGNNVLNGAEGVDTLSYVYATSAVTMSLASTVAQVTGGSGSDTVLNVENLVGSGYNDKLTGNAGGNTLNGGAGGDTMIGGAGSDVYYVDNAADVITELANEGADFTYAYINYTLGANIENASIAASTAVNITGNALANTLFAGLGSNVINGMDGTDTASYVNVTSGVAVNLGLTTAQATGGSGSDTLLNIENLIGSAYNDTLTGNAGANTLTAGAGNDTLLGAAGNDTLDGAAGADSMSGGLGDDIYNVDNAADVVTELAGEGTDTVYATVSYTLGATLENLLINTTAAANATGNALNNVLTIGAGNNVVNGLDGIDTASYSYAASAVTASLAITTAQATGGSGSDTLLSIENLIGSGYNDTLTGNAGANALTGGGGNDALNGGAGSDTLAGGAGNDTYRLDRGSGLDIVVENDAAAGNADVAVFGADIAAEQLWFRQVGNNLEVSVIGGADQFTINGWYLGSQYHVEQFRTSGGKTLLDSQVQNLVQAMSSFAPPVAGQTTLPANYQTSLAPVFAANWH